MDHLPLVEYELEENIFIYDIDTKVGDFVGELARRSIDEDEKTVKLIRYNNHIIYVEKIKNFFKCIRCPTCDTIFKLSKNLKKASSTMQKSNRK